LAGLGVADLVVGFAFQDSLSNLFAGMAILASRPYGIDDIVEAAGVVGRVRLKLWPWVHTADWWALTADLPRIVRLGLAREGSAIPYPRREIVSGPDTGDGGGPPADGMPSPSD
jgi:small-conductance mechanosensitive channel